MKNIFALLYLVKNYKVHVSMNIIFNVLSMIFGIFSFVMFIPFLEILFSEEKFSKILAEGKNISNISFDRDALLSKMLYEMAIFVNDNGKFQMLLFICLIIIVMIFLKNIFRYFAMYYIENVKQGVVKDFRNQMYNKIFDLPMSFFTEEKKGDMISRMTNDVKEIEHSILKSIETLYKDPLNIVLTLSILIFISPQMTLSILFMVLIFGIIGIIGKKLKSNSEKAQNLLGEIMSKIDETLTGVKVIKAFNMEKKQYNDFKTKNELYNNLILKVQRRINIASPLSEFLGVGVIIMVILYGGNLVFSGKLSGSTLISYIGLFYTIIEPAKSLSNSIFNAQKGIASLNRINEILDINNEVVDKPSNIENFEFKTKISFVNVNFHYKDGKKVLQNINFDIEKGKTIALVGQSGSGKSTIANLLPRFYDINDGAINIENINIRDIKLKALREKIGVVSQEAILFNDTIKNNILFGSNKTDSEIINAAKIANAHEFITQLENGYDTNIGDSGNKLSGGQKQRISIARAILKNPEILILDEATSALDTESEKYVQSAIENLMKNRTSLVIAHRLSTIKNADEIIVMKEGKIIERGNHTELMKLGNEYFKYVELQV